MLAKLRVTFKRMRPWSHTYVGLGVIVVELLHQVLRSDQFDLDRTHTCPMSSEQGRKRRAS
jgi:hypothetical protein